MRTKKEFAAFLDDNAHYIRTHSCFIFEMERDGFIYELTDKKEIDIANKMQSIEDEVELEEFWLSLESEMYYKFEDFYILCLKLIGEWKKIEEAKDLSRRLREEEE